MSLHRHDTASAVMYLCRGGQQVCLAVTETAPGLVEEIDVSTGHEWPGRLTPEERAEERELLAFDRVMRRPMAEVTCPRN